MFFLPPIGYGIYVGIGALALYLSGCGSAGGGGGSKPPEVDDNDQPTDNDDIPSDEPELMLSQLDESATSNDPQGIFSSKSEPAPNEFGFTVLNKPVIAGQRAINIEFVDAKNEDEPDNTETPEDESNTAGGTLIANTEMNGYGLPTAPEENFMVAVYRPTDTKMGMAITLADQDLGYNDVDVAEYNLEQLDVFPIGQYGKVIIPISVLGSNLVKANGDGVLNLEEGGLVSASLTPYLKTADGNGVTVNSLYIDNLGFTDQSGPILNSPVEGGVVNGETIISYTSSSFGGEHFLVIKDGAGNQSEISLGDVNPNENLEAVIDFSFYQQGTYTLMIKSVDPNLDVDLFSHNAAKVSNISAGAPIHNLDSLTNVTTFVDADPPTDTFEISTNTDPNNLIEGTGSLYYSGVNTEIVSPDFYAGGIFVLGSADGNPIPISNDLPPFQFALKPEQGDAFTFQAVVQYADGDEDSQNNPTRTFGVKIQDTYWQNIAELSSLKNFLKIGTTLDDLVNTDNTDDVPDGTAVSDLIGDPNVLGIIGFNFIPHGSAAAGPYVSGYVDDLRYGVEGPKLAALPENITRGDILPISWTDTGSGPYSVKVYSRREGRNTLLDVEDNTSLDIDTTEFCAGQQGISVISADGRISIQNPTVTFLAGGEYPIDEECEQQH
jgi:hypothetical protein